MKACLGRLSLPGLSLLLAVLILASVGWAQSSDGTVPAALAGTVLMFVVVICLAGYVYVALALQTIATKTNTENAWFAWIPIANIFLMLSIAKKPMWWFILFLVPLANIVVAIMVWMAVAEARHKPNWWGILTIVPVVNIVVPGYLAWSD
jgi:hypothetical protein